MRIVGEIISTVADLLDAPPLSAGRPTGFGTTLGRYQV
jgi:hypothetical protein